MLDECSLSGCLHSLHFTSCSVSLIFFPAFKEEKQNPKFPPSWPHCSHQPTGTATPQQIPSFCPTRLNHTALTDISASDATYSLLTAVSNICNVFHFSFLPIPLKLLFKIPQFFVYYILTLLKPNLSHIPFIHLLLTEED